MEIKTNKPMNKKKNREEKEDREREKERVRGIERDSEGDMCRWNKSVLVCLAPVRVGGSCLQKF